MKLLELQNNKIVISISEDELFILRAVLSEIYAGVCIDPEELEIIHGLNRSDVLKLDSEFQKLYDEVDIA